MNLKAIVTSVALAATVTLLGGTLASAAPVNPNGSGPVRQAVLAPNSITNSGQVAPDALEGSDIKPLWSSDIAAPAWAQIMGVPYNTVGTQQLKADAITPDKLAPALRAKIDASAILSVTADTMLTDRNDTATDGSVWAKDSMTRTLTVVRQHATEASKCGASATECWFYTGTIRDNGTFKTVAGAHGPNSLTPINGIVTGTVNGVYKIEFNASSDAPNPANVDPTVTGGTSTGNWMKLVFPAGTQFSALTGVEFRWDYISSLCELHTQATSGNVGDILGVNKCS